MNYIRHLTAAVVLGTLGLPMTSSAIAQLNTSTHTKMPIENLKGTYLQCERAAVRGKLVTGDSMLCSVIYEELKQRAFDGDFKRLKAWADEHLRPAEADLTGSK